MHRIVIELSDNVSDAEADEIVREIRERVTGDEYGDVWPIRFTYRELNAREISVSERVYRAAQNGVSIELERDAIEALWQRILNDARYARAIVRR